MWLAILLEGKQQSRVQTTYWTEQNFIDAVLNNSSRLDNADLIIGGVYFSGDFLYVMILKRRVLDN